MAVQYLEEEMRSNRAVLRMVFCLVLLIFAGMGWVVDELVDLNPASWICIGFAVVALVGAVYDYLRPVGQITPYRHAR